MVHKQGNLSLSWEGNPDFLNIKSIKMLGYEKVKLVA